MRLLKFLVVLTFSAFTFFVVPTVVGCRAQEPQVLQVQGPDAGPDIDELLQQILKPVPKAEPPKVVCTGKPCVPRYRFSSRVTEESVKTPIAWIEAANRAGADAVLFEINSGGGELPGGFELARSIEESQAPVVCVVDGEANSMAFYILQSCDRRGMTKRSRLMAHEPSWHLEAGGNPNDWRGLSDNIATLSTNFAYWCAHRLKVSLKEYHERVDGNKQWWMLPDEALKVGAVDNVVESVRQVHNFLLSIKPPR